MVEDPLTGIKSPEQYNKVTDPTTRGELQTDLNFINGEIARETGRGRPLVETGMRGVPLASVDEQYVSDWIHANGPSQLVKQARDVGVPDAKIRGWLRGAGVKNIDGFMGVKAIPKARSGAR